MIILISMDKHFIFFIFEYMTSEEQLLRAAEAFMWLAVRGLRTRVILTVTSWPNAASVHSFTAPLWAVTAPIDTHLFALKWKCRPI